MYIYIYIYIYIYVCHLFKALEPFGGIAKE